MAGGQSVTYIPNATDFDILRQGSKTNYARLILMDAKMNPIKEITGDIIDGRLTIDGSADVRRSCSLTINVSREHSLLAANQTALTTRLINLELGSLHLRNNEIIWYQAGIFTFDATNYNYDATSHTLEMSCLDMMAYLDGTRGTQLTEFTTQIFYDDYDFD